MMAKVENSELERLLGLEKRIYLGAEQKMEDASAGIRTMWTMFRDLQEICETVFDALKETSSQLERQKDVNEDMNRKLAEQERLIQEYKKKAEVYEKLQLDGAKLAKLLVVNDQERDRLCKEREKLEKEKDAFEGERVQLITEKDEALKKAEAHKNEKKEAIQSRDDAIKETNRRKEEITLKDKVIVRLTEEKTNKVRNLNQELKWLRDYAEALDDKVIRYFKDDEKHDLKTHYKDYLNNPDKWEEHRKHFPEFDGIEKKKEENPIKDEIEEKIWDRQEDNALKTQEDRGEVSGRNPVSKDD